MEPAARDVVEKMHALAATAASVLPAKRDEMVMAERGWREARKAERGLHDLAVQRMEEFTATWRQLQCRPRASWHARDVRCAPGASDSRSPRPSATQCRTWTSCLRLLKSPIVSVGLQITNWAACDTSDYCPRHRASLRTLRALRPSCTSTRRS